MKKILLGFLLIFSFAALYGQTTNVFRMIGSATWSTVNDSTYQGTVNFFADLTGKGYLATGILVDSFRVFSNTGQVYRIDSVGTTTFSSAFLRIVEYGTTQASPTGQIMVYNPLGVETVPQCPFGSTGATAQIQAAIDTYNASLVSSTATDLSAVTVYYDSLVLGNVTAWVKRIGGTLTTLTNPVSGQYNVTISEGADLQSVTVQGNNTTLNGSNEMVIKIVNSANNRSRRAMLQLYDVQNNALVDQQVTGTNHISVVSGATTTVTIPGLNGFGATGYLVEIR